MHHRAVLALLLLAALLPHTAQADYRNGSMEIGEAFKLFYQSGSVSVYRLTYGLSFFQLWSPDNTSLVALLRHVPCPDGSTCFYDKQEQVVVRLALPQLRVAAKEPVPPAAMGEFRAMQYHPEAVFPTGAGGARLVGLTWNATSGGRTLASLAMPAGDDQRSVWPANAFWPSMMQPSPYSQALHLWEYPAYVDRPSTLRVYDTQLAPTLEYATDINARPQASAIRPAGAGNPSAVFFALGFPNGSVGVARYPEEQPSALRIELLEGGLQVVGMTVDPSSHALYVFRQNVTKLDRNDLHVTTALQINVFLTDYGEFKLNATVTVPATWEFAGAFFYRERFFTYNWGAQLLRFPEGPLVDPFPVVDALSISVTDDFCNPPNRGFRPYTYALTVIGDTAWVGADWWGYLLAIDLSRFCVDSECRKCSPRHSDPKKKAALVAGIVVPISAAIVVVLVIHRRRRLRALLSRTGRYEAVGDAPAGAAAAAPAKAAFFADTADEKRRLQESGTFAGKSGIGDGQL